ncbi:MAG TPA: tetratricopeptide repeat protein [Polyangiaceae bacterium]|nr:tetratricopeptide repeat protein [Polyangiaceae bacterium]
MNRLFLTCAALSSVLGVTLAHAEADRGAAVVLFDQAQALIESGKFSEACPKFAESYRLDPQLGVLLHLAECYERTGRFASAWVAFRDAIELAERRSDGRAAAAREHASALEPKLSHLSVVVPSAALVDGLKVQRDGIELSPALWGSPLPVDPGEHVIEVSAPGKQSFRSTVSVKDPGEVASVNVPVLSDLASKNEAPTALDVNVASPPRSSFLSPPTRTWLGIGALGLGATSAIVGIVFHAQRASKIDDRDAICPSSMNCTRDEANRIDQLTDEARSAATIGTVGLAIGGAFIATGAVLLLTAPRDGGAPREAAIGRGLTLSPVFSPALGHAGSAPRATLQGLVMRGSF